MHFSLHTLAETSAGAACYFRMYSADHAPVYSPLYSDRAAALKGMEKLVRALRQTGATAKIKPRRKSANFILEPFGKTAPAVGKGPFFTDQESARQAREDWQAAALATTFRVLHFALEPAATEEEPPITPDLSETDQHLNWRETGSSLLHVGRKKREIDLPAIGVHLSPSDGGPCAPIFCAMQPFVAADIALFHGRNKEVEEVEALLAKRPVLLLYGAPRVGKTSLLQCGLNNRLKKEADSLVVVKKTQEDILLTLATEFRKHIPAGPGEDMSLVTDPLLLARRLPAAQPGRNILVFDQLENLFKADIFDAERASLFRFIRELVKGDDHNFRVILSMREAYLAPLAEYEDELPALLDNRYRLLPLKQSSMVNATANLLDFLKLGDKIAVDDPREVAGKVSAELANEKGEVPLHCMQIYLHQLHQESCRETNSGPVPMTPELVDRLGPAPQLIDAFYQERLGALASQLPEEGAPPNPILESEIEELENARLHCGCDKKKSAAAGAAVVAAPAGMGWLAAALLALIPFGLFFLYWWFTPAEQPPTACELLREEDSCVAYVNYLCASSPDSTCTAEIETMLAEKQCDVWQDYRKLQRQPGCATYRAFFEKYRDRGICMERVQAKLLEWECPIVRDTVIREVEVPVMVPTPGPSTYGPTPSAPQPGDPCKQQGGYTFKQVGPLWIATEALSGGPYRWEDALEACKNRGWRLPCIGEIDFLIAKIYRDDAKRAFEMLAGKGSCDLVDVSATPGGRIEFWTATESNDEAAWSYFFDGPSEVIGRQSNTPKSARLPCLCVEKDVNSKGSSIPPCYQKSVDRVLGK